jgi:hypothetical protein
MEYEDDVLEIEMLDEPFQDIVMQLQSIAYVIGLV